MANNNSYIKAKKDKNDEFYTIYDYIQKEVNAYLEYDPDTFKDKVVLLPCDDPEWSNFTKFFAQNFEKLGLKKLISTSYSLDRKKEKYQNYRQLTLFETESPEFDEDKAHTRGKIFTLLRDKNKSGNIDFDDLEWKYLDGNGSFLSEELIELRNEADVIVTNPPFSLFKEFITWVFEADKKCLLIGNIGMATYREAFLLIKENKLWVGATNNGQDMVFEVPEGAFVSDEDKKKAERIGYFGNYTRQGNSC